MAWPTLTNDEELVLDLRPHWLYFLEPAITLIATVVIWIVLAAVLGWSFLNLVAVGVLLAGALWMLKRFADWRTTRFIVTTDRVMYRSGWVSKSGIEIPLIRINNVNFRQGVFERMVGAGDLLIESGGETGQSRFSDVRKPDVVSNIVHTEMNNSLDGDARLGRQQSRLGTDLVPPDPSTAAGSSVPASGDALSQLERLESLLAKGTITQEEFDAQKRKLLDRL